MRIREVVNLSLKLMLRNRLRSALTILGIVIGIASIIIVFSAGEGIRSLITSQIESLELILFILRAKFLISKKVRKLLVKVLVRWLAEFRLLL